MTRSLPQRATVNVLIAGAALAFAIPFLVMIFTSLKSMEEIRNGSPLALPESPSFVAWAKAWGGACIAGHSTGISRSFANSFAIVLPALAVTLALGSLTGYAMTVRPSRHAEILFRLLLIGMFIPVQLTLFPMIVMVRETGLFGTRGAAILVHAVWGLPFTTLLFRNYFLSVPRNILQAARIDGAGFIAILWHVILPMSLPILAVVAALQFTFLWNEFLLNLTFAGSGNEPVTVALSILNGAQLETQEHNVNMAASLIAALPTILIYLLSGGVFLRGITAGTRA